MNMEHAANTAQRNHQSIFNVNFKDSLPIKALGFQNQIPYLDFTLNILLKWEICQVVRQSVGNPLDRGTNHITIITCNCI